MNIFMLKSILTQQFSGSKDWIDRNYRVTRQVYVYQRKIWLINLWMFLQTFDLRQAVNNAMLKKSI